MPLSIRHAGRQLRTSCSNSLISSSRRARARSKRVTAGARCQAVGCPKAKSASPVDAVDLKSYTLPNGLSIRHTSSSAEVEFLYREHVQQRVYLQHQVNLRPGGVVLDVGANIGLFAMAAAEDVGAAGCVICVEPEPRAAAALRHNITAHAHWCAAQGKQAAPCVVVEAAAADGTETQAHLTVYQGASGWSTLVRDDQELMDNMKTYIAHLLQDTGAQQTGSSATSNSSSSTTALSYQIQAHAGNASQGWALMQQALAGCGGWLTLVPGLAPVAHWVAKLYVQQVMMGDANAVTVDTCTVSDLIHRQNIQCVNLLKVDVERAELDVLLGVQPRHWPLIQQVAMEVHDTCGRLKQVVNLLRQQAGFQIVVWEQGAQLQGSTLHNLYAVKGGAPQTRS